MRSVSIVVSWITSFSCLRCSLYNKRISLEQEACSWPSTQLFLDILPEIDKVPASMPLTFSEVSLPEAMACVNFFRTSNSLICYLCTSSKYFSKLVIDADILVCCSAKRELRSFLMTSRDSFILSPYYCRLPSIRLITLLITSACLLSWRIRSLSASWAAICSGVY